MLMPMDRVRDLLQICRVNDTVRAYALPCVPPRTNNLRLAFALPLQCTPPLAAHIPRSSSHRIGRRSAVPARFVCDTRCDPQIGDEAAMHLFVLARWEEFGGRGWGKRCLGARCLC